MAAALGALSSAVNKKAYSTGQNSLKKVE